MNQRGAPQIGMKIGGVPRGVGDGVQDVEVVLLGRSGCGSGCGSECEARWKWASVVASIRPLLPLLYQLTLKHAKIKEP